MKIVTILFACLSGFAFINKGVAADQVYQEQKGVVIIEAENTTSPLGKWQRKDSIRGFTGAGYLDFTGNNFLSGPPNSPLEYKFKINQTGLYFLHLHCARETQVIKGETRKDVANDCFVRVEGDYGAGPNPGDKHGKDAPLALLKKDTKFFGGKDMAFVWVSGNHLDPGGHNNKRVAVYRFKAGKTYKLVVSGRSKAYKLDRIVFRLKSVPANAAQNRGAKETLATETKADHVFNAIKDFPNQVAGVVPFYQDKRNNALAIRANVVKYRDKFASATRKFDGKSDRYDIKLTTLTEEDGESTYQILINDSVVGTFKNDHIGAGSQLDMMPKTHWLRAIKIHHGDTISVQGKTATNGEIPEGDGTAWARGRWRKIEFKKSSTLMKPPAGRLAIVADGNSPDPDDIGATAIMFGILKASELSDRLVHLSHSCDLKPVSRISKADELRRQKILHQICNDGVSHFGPFKNLVNFFNCRTHQKEAVNDLRDAINASTKDNPLWIVEAGEPDVIGFALKASSQDKHKYVHVISHHPANDDSGDFFSWQQILEFGVREHQIGDQNIGLQTPMSSWDWAKEHCNAGVNWIWEQLKYAEQDGVVKFQTNKFDGSDAGMVYWWITGANRGGNAFATPAELRKLLQ